MIFFRENTIKRLEEEKLVVIVRGVAREDLIPMAEAMYEGGVRLLELTYSATGNVSDSTIAANIEMLVRHFGDRMSIGAGTVLTTEQVELTFRAGGQFIISPDTNPEVIEYTRMKDMVSIPGAMTPTECQLAHRHGADFVKLFPVGTLGAEYLSAIKAPLAHIRFLAVGGVSLVDIEKYRAAGAIGFGIGASIVDKRLIAEKRFSDIAALAKEYVAAIKEA